MSGRLRTAIEKPTDDKKKELREVGRRLFILCSPWKSWTVSGCYIVGSPGTLAAEGITATDSIGNEILSHVPVSLVADFLSRSGQSFVSRPSPHCTTSILINNLDHPQVASAMSSLRSSHINRLRANGTLIFGSGFQQEWFPSKFERGSVETLQKLLGAHMTPKGKKYLLLPPILYLDGSSKNKRDLFLNPALIKVSTFAHVHYVVC